MIRPKKSFPTDPIFENIEKVSMYKRIPTLIPEKKFLFFSQNFHILIWNQTIISTVFEI